MIVTIDGKRWDLQFLDDVRDDDGKKADGTCDPPDRKGKTIKIRNGMSELLELDTIIHECLHAGVWQVDEAFIEQVSTDIAKILFRLEYRRNKGE